MVISGLQKLTLLDYPGHTACTVFTPHCNWRCPFCHNASLVLADGSLPELDQEEFFSFLRKRRGLLDGVAVTGGEPTIHADLPEFVRRIRSLGFPVKLDTNGYHPDMLRRLLEEKLIDYAAMDIKNSPEKYAVTAGTERLSIDAVHQSVRYLMRQGRIPYEFRTTVVRQYHTAEDFVSIGKWIRGAEAYYLQNFQNSGRLIDNTVTGCTPAEMRSFLETVRRDVPNAALRGI
jgi:pyruvate formate lyase activating enzyme